MPYLGLPLAWTQRGRANPLANHATTRMRHSRFAAIEWTNASSFRAALPELAAVDGGSVWLRVKQTAALTRNGRPPQDPLLGRESA